MGETGEGLAFLVVAVLTCGSCAREPCQKLSQASQARQDPEQALLEGNFERRPRCTPTESGCGPMPVHAGGQACYRPSSERKRLPERPAQEGRSLDPKFACTQDGECNVTGCGNVCTTFRAGPMETECIGYAWLDEAEFCGCIQGECAFFKQ